MNENFYLKKLDEEFQPNHDKISCDNYFTESDYEELQRNLILYKEGNREACTYIIRTFHPFITKYTRFICNGDLPYYIYTDKNGRNYKKVSTTISQFVSLFIDKTEDKTETKEKKKIFSNTCVKIKKLFSKYEYSDIYNELVLALLNMANKYKIITNTTDPHYKKNGTFHMYVSKCFHWEAHRFLKVLIKDPLSHFEVLKLQDQFDDLEIDDNDKIVPGVILKCEKSELEIQKMLDRVSRENDISSSTKLTMKEENIDPYDIESLNFNWTNGITCSELFKILSPYEREIIVFSFIDKKSEEEIGEIYGCHRTTINSHKRKAIEKLKAKLIEKNYFSQ